VASVSVVDIPLVHVVECDSSKLLSAVDSLEIQVEVSAWVDEQSEEDSLRVVQNELDSTLVVHIELDSAAEEDASVDSEGQNIDVDSDKVVQADDSWLVSVGKIVEVVSSSEVGAADDVYKGRDVTSDVVAENFEDSSLAGCVLYVLVVEELSCISELIEETGYSAVCLSVAVLAKDVP